MLDVKLSPDLSAGLKPQAPDPLLSLIPLYNADPRRTKIDLGVGVYRDEHGATPVFQAVKAAETVLLRDQATKAYLGPEGDLEFLVRIAAVVFGEAAKPADLISVQTPGGTGALRLAAELIAAGGTGARIWMGTPSWAIHAGIFGEAGLGVRTVPYFARERLELTFDRFLDGLQAIAPGDVVLIQGSCHNPTGADLSLEQWAALADLICRRGAIPLVDLAYQGLGGGLDEDAAGLRLLTGRCETIIVAQSCDKNFGVYRERTGALFVRTPAASRELVRSNLLQLARCLWSMPADHGAAVVRLVFESGYLVAQWRAELEAMRLRLGGIREALATALPRLEPLRGQNGLFALLPLCTEAVEALRRDHAVYVVGSGRINLAGLNPQNLSHFVRALAGVI
jgi:aromatic-amino-acid transaminase